MREFCADSCRIVFGERDGEFFIKVAEYVIEIKSAQAEKLRNWAIYELIAGAPSSILKIPNKAGLLVFQKFAESVLVFLESQGESVCHLATYDQGFLRFLGGCDCE